MVAEIDPVAVVPSAGPPPKSSRVLWLAVYNTLSLRLNGAMSKQHHTTVNNNGPSGVVDGVCAF